MYYFRSSVAVVFAALLAVGPRANAAQSPIDTPGFAPRLTAYLASGAANACGPGCSHWIAVEGRIDAEAAGRFRAFLHHIKDEALPFYFNSPGGDLRQGLAIGRLLHRRRATARVGRTHVTACGDDPQIDDKCEKIKASGKELEASIITSRAMCNSACSYLFLGASTREVAPDAVVGIHNTRIILRFRGRPRLALREKALEISRERADRNTASYVAAMGISPKLIDLAQATPFEKPHLLTRQELYHFGIDRRDFAETAWTLNLNKMPSVRKLVTIRSGNDVVRTEGWQLFCRGKDRVRLAIIREIDPSVKGVGIAIENDQRKIIPVTGPPRRAGKYWGVNAIIKSADMPNLLDTGHLRIAEVAYSNGGNEQTSIFAIDMSTLDHVWAQFSLACAASTISAARTPNWPSVTTPPVVMTPMHP